MPPSYMIGVYMKTALFKVKFCYCSFSVRNVNGKIIKVYRIVPIKYDNFK